MHTVVARHKADLDNVRMEVGKYVQETLASVHAQSTSGDGGKGVGGVAPRQREAPQLNGPKKNEVDSLSDTMSNAASVLWRDNLALQLEGCNDFGMGTPKMLKVVRLHTRIIDRVAMLEFYQEVMSTGRAAGNQHILLRCQMGAADRELYKFLHTRLTVKSKATSVSTC